MANKFFSYSFQVERTKKTGVIFVIFVVLVLVGAFLFYRSKNNVETVDKLNYKIVFGANEFEDGNCTKAYRINSEKRTCGTICIKDFKKDSNYQEKLRKELEKNGFTLKDTITRKINGQKWQYITTKDVSPSISYYINSDDNKTYSIEYIDQTSYLPKSIKASCNKTTNTLLKSIKVK